MSNTEGYLPYLGSDLADALDAPYFDHEAGEHEKADVAEAKVILNHAGDAYYDRKKFEDAQHGKKRRLSHVLHATVVADHHGDLAGLFEKARRHMATQGFHLANCKDRYRNLTLAGHRGGSSDWLDPDGRVAEIHFYDQHTLKAKNEGRAHYRQAHDLADNAMNRDLSEEEAKAYFGHIDRMRHLYDEAWKRNGGAIPESVVASKDLPAQAIYFDYDGLAAYQDRLNGPAYALIDGEWRHVNRAEVHHDSPIMKLSGTTDPWPKRAGRVKHLHNLMDRLRGTYQL